MEKKEKINLMIWIWVWIIVLILLLVSVKIFSSGKPLLTQKKPKILTEVLFESWDYKIWKIDETFDICHNASGCLIWEILSMKQEWDSIYMFYDFDFDKSKKWYWDKSSIEYRYCTYSNDDCFMLDDLNLIPELLLLKENKLTMWTKKDVPEFDEETKAMFEELERVRSIELDWVEYR